jgi:peptide/nickel transport system substrate-binding protein
MDRRRSVASRPDRRGFSPFASLARPRGRAFVFAALIIAALALSACGGSSSSGGSATGSLSSPGLYGKVPPAGTPTHGGTITFGQLNGNTPNYIFPITPSGNASTYNYAWQQVMYVPLYNNFAYGGSPGVNFPITPPKKPVFPPGKKKAPNPPKKG